VESVIAQMYGLYPLGTGPKLLLVDRKYYLPPFSNNTDSPEHNYAIPNAHQIIPVKFDEKVMMSNCQNAEREVQKNIQQQLNVYN
jgi:hypothetical protein